jgi:alpha-ketoglutaric semialdehyde dehydrogenase
MHHACPASHAVEAALGRAHAIAAADALDAVGNEIAARKGELADLPACEEGKALSDATGEAVRAGQIFSSSPARRCVYPANCCPTPIRT